MGRVFRKAFRILGLGERKGRWAMEQVMEIFGSMSRGIATSASGCYFNVNTIHSHLNIHILLEPPTFPMVG